LGSSSLPNKVLVGKFHGRPRLRCKDVRKNSTLLLNLCGWRKYAGHKDIWSGQGPMRAVASLQEKNIWRSLHSMQLSIMPCSLFLRRHFSWSSCTQHFDFRHLHWFFHRILTRSFTCVPNRKYGFVCLKCNVSVSELI
jgi:hypothetical protein